MSKKKYIKALHWRGRKLCKMLQKNGVDQRAVYKEQAMLWRLEFEAAKP